MNPVDFFYQLINDEIITNKDQTTVDMDVKNNDTKWSDISVVDLIAICEKLDNGLCPISADLTKCMDKVDLL